MILEKSTILVYQIHYINEKINVHAIHLLEEYKLSNGVELADALIAATALFYGEELGRVVNYLLSRLNTYDAYLH